MLQSERGEYFRNYSRVLIWCIAIKHAEGLEGHADNETVMPFADLYA